MSSALKKKAVKGITWNLIEKFGLQGIKLFLGVWLARLLTPADYGLVGMITVFFTVAAVFVDSGFASAYVQKKDVDDLDANTVFYTNLVISLAAYGGLWLAAPLIAGFYNQPLLVSLTRVMGAVVIINAFNTIQMALLTRTIDFKRKTKITLTASFLSGISGIASALSGLGVWSLVVQQLTNRILTTSGMWLTSSWRPKLQFSWNSFHSMFSFGFWVLASGIVRTLFDNIYILTIGKFFPVAQLGYYSKAKQFQSLAAQQLSGAVGAVAFPVLSRMQQDKQRLKEGVRTFLTHTMVFTGPMLVVLMVFAKPFVLIVLTDKWAPMIPYMQLLCIAGFLYPIHAVNVQVLQAQGASNLNFRITVIKNSLRILNIAITWRFGVLFIIIGEIVTSYLALMINTYYTKKLVGYGLVDQIKDLKQISLSVIFAGVFGFAVLFSISNQYITLFLAPTVTIATYCVLQYLFNKVFFMGLLRLKENFAK